MGVIRTWRCLNSRCASTFDSWEANPACPKCQCVRVDWQPAGGHIAGVSRSGDAELRALADVFRMNDMHSAEEGRAAKKVHLPPTPAANEVPAMRFGGGFAARVDPGRAMTSENPSGAQCVPTANRIDYRAKAGMGQALPANSSYPGIRSNTTIEATHRPAR